MKYLGGLLVVLCLSGLAPLAYAETEVPAQIIKITDAADLALAHKLDDAVHAVSSRVTECVNRGGTTAACQCQNKEAMEYSHATVTGILAQRPDWQDDNVILFWETGGKAGEPPIMGHNLASGRLVKFLDQSLNACTNEGKK